jgi:outer membrane murein-binding lipoprotein Lpp
MRCIAAAGLLVLCGGCHHEPSFDERYASVQQTLGSEAAALDSDLKSRESDAAAAGATDEAVSTARE